MKAVKNKNGFTLIEVVISMALLSLIFIIFAALFMFSANLLGLASRRKIGNMDASSKIELYTAGSIGEVVPVSDSFSISFGGVNVSVAGDYITAADSKNQVSYKSFLPDDIP